MHYGNGREAKNGDKAVLLPDPKYGGTPVIGILYDAKPGNDSCNGKLAPISYSDPCPNLAECLHLDDFNVLLALGRKAKAALDAENAEKVAAAAGSGEEKATTGSSGGPGQNLHSQAGAAPEPVPETGSTPT